MAEVCRVIEGLLEAEGLGIKDPCIAKVAMGNIVEAASNEYLIMINRYHKVGHPVDGLS